jgi:hypothetical protein
MGGCNGGMAEGAYTAGVRNSKAVESRFTRHGRRLHRHEHLLLARVWRRVTDGRMDVWMGEWIYGWAYVSS